MEYLYSTEKPDLVENISRFAQTRFALNVLIEKMADGQYRWIGIQPEFGPLRYEDIVDKIISSQYPTDKMLAIINNYLVDPTSEHISEYTEMQAFRLLAKKEAKECIAFAKDKGWM